MPRSTLFPEVPSPRARRVGGGSAVGDAVEWAARSAGPWIALAPLLLAVFVAGAGAESAAVLPEVGPAARLAEFSMPSELPWIRPAPLRERLEELYGDREGRPLWWIHGALRPEAERVGELFVWCPSLLEDRVRISGERLQAFARWSSRTDTSIEARARVEADLTATVLRCAERAAAEREELGRSAGWPLEQAWSPPEPLEVLSGFDERGGFDTAIRALRELSPPHPQFERLGRQLERLEAVAGAGGWPEVPEGPALKPGDRTPESRLEALARRLEAEGFLASGGSPPADLRVDSRSLSEALRAFQRSRNLPADGVLDAATQEALAVPVEEIVRKLRLNLVRSRWLPALPETPTILVNLPAFRLKARGPGGSSEHRVIVGQPDWPSPVFRDAVEYLVANPEWHVPTEISVAEVIPRLLEDPSRIRKEGFRFYEGWGGDAERLRFDEVDWQAWLREPDEKVRVVQGPGPENPLGRLKLMLPNEHDVYLHDTSARNLFHEDDRDLSHGCIRVEEPLRLVEVLFGPAFARRTEAAIRTGTKRTLDVPTEVPVLIVYFTAWVDEKGRLELFDDPYGRDRQLQQRIAKLSSGSTSASPGGKAASGRNE